MSLKDLELPSAKVQVSDEVFFTVRGLSLSDISVLLNSHGKELGMIFEKVKDELQGRSEGITANDVQYFAKVLFDKAPDMVARAIALAADDPGEEDKIKRLRFTVQIIAIQEVLRLTFTTEAELKKLVEIVIQWLGKINSEAERITSSLPSLVGSGESESK